MTTILARLAVLFLLLIGGLGVVGNADGQQLRTSSLAEGRWSAAHGAISQETAMVSASFERVVVGSTLGTIAGAAAGLGIAALVYSVGDRPDADMFPMLGEAVLIGLPVTALGAWAGTRIASGGAGNPWITGVAAVAGLGIGVGLGVLAGDASGSEAIGIGVALPIAIILPVVAEVLAAR